MRVGGTTLPATGWEWAAAVTSWVGYIGLLLAAGGVFYLVFVHDGRDDERRWGTTVVIGAAILAAAMRLLAEPVRAVQLTGLGAASLFDTRAYAVSLRSSDGWSTLIRLVGLSLLLIGIVRRNRSGRGLALVGAVVALVSTSFAGHTVSGEPQWLVRGADVAHMVSGAAWFGGLVLLGASLRRRWGDGDPLGSAALVARFSTMATLGIALVLTAGLAMAWAEIRNLDALVDSGYGITLLIKVAIVVAITAVGAYNNRLLVPGIQRAAAGVAEDERGLQAWRRLGTTVRLEIVGLVLVLAVTGVLVHEAPPRPQTETHDDATASHGRPGHDAAESIP